MFKGRKILVMGLRNKWSIVWGIAKALKDQNAEVILTYQGEREREGALQLSKELGSVALYSCDVSKDEDIKTLFEVLEKNHGLLHGMVHGIAHAKREDIQNRFVETSREGFAHALNISAYSLVSLSREASRLMKEGGSIVSLTYMGAEKVFPGYNVMGVAKAALEACVRYLAHDLGASGIRINAISAGPIKTISSKAIKDFGQIMDVFEDRAPLKEELNPENLAGTALFLLSELSRVITGEIIYTDCGYNIMGI